MRTAIYCRVSTAEQAKEGYSLAAQESSLRKFAESQGWTVAGVYVEEGKSGKDTNRPELQRLLADASGKAFDVVLVWKLDRFTRSVADCDRLLRQLDKSGVKFKSATEPFETTSAIGKLFVHLVSAMAQFERENLGERVRQGMRQMASEGHFTGGPPPYGYSYSSGRLTPRQPQASTVRRIFERYVSGAPVRAIVRELNAEWTPTPQGGSGWTYSGVYYILRNPVYAARIGFGKRGAGRKWQEHESFEASHEPIVSAALWDDARRLRENKGSIPARSAAGVYPLTGRLFCGRCGTKMHGRKSGHRGARTYICYARSHQARCDMPMFSADEIEAAVVKSIKLRATAADRLAVAEEVTRAALGDEESKALEKEISRALSAKERWLDLFERQALDERTLSDRIDSVNAQIRALEHRLAEVQRHRPFIPAKQLAKLMARFPAFWRIAEPAERQATVLLLTDRITLYPDKTVSVDLA